MRIVVYRKNYIFLEQYTLYILYNKIALPAGGGQEQLPPKSQIFGKNQNFSDSNKKNLGKIRNFEAATRNYLSKTIFS